MIGVETKSVVGPVKVPEFASCVVCQTPGTNTCYQIRDSKVPDRVAYVYVCDVEKCLVDGLQRAERMTKRGTDFGARPRTPHRISTPSYRKVTPEGPKTGTHG